MSEQTPQSIERLAQQLLRAGRVMEALSVYEQLVELRPEQPDYWFDLAHVQGKARRFEAALSSYQTALSRGVRDPEEVHVNRSVILDHLERHEEAELALRAALAVKPGYIPALLNLGTLQEDRGEDVKARSTYEQALAADPSNATALARLAGVTPVTRQHASIVGRLRDAISRPGLSHIDQASLGFALGHALDALDSFDAAFAAFEAANRANRLSGGRAGQYDPQAHENLVDRLIAAFPEPVPSREGDQTSPLFICGMFRSGSTLTERILAAHPAVTSGGELDIVPTLVRSRINPYPEAVLSAADEQIDGWRKFYLDGLRMLHPAARLVADKRPDNFLHIGLIKTLFPSAKIVNTCRNPLDNGLSIYFLHLNPRISYSHDLSDIGHWYRQYRRLMLHWKSLYPEDILDFHYDELVADPRPTVRGLLEFLGLDWEEACLDFHRSSGVVKTASVWQVRRPIYERSSGRWRNYQSHLSALRDALEE